jgi:hypothetical protein
MHLRHGYAACAAFFVCVLSGVFSEASAAWDKSSDDRGLWSLRCEGVGAPVSRIIVGGKDGSGFLLAPSNGGSGIVVKGAEATDERSSIPFVLVITSGRCDAVGLYREKSDGASKPASGAKP